MSKLSALGITLLTLIGMPLFAVMGAISLLSWMGHDRPEMQAVRFIAPSVLEDRFVASPILVTIPLFTFVGYLMAESKTPDRLVRASSVLLGWLPGGLAIVCIVASAFFTTMTGGSGVTIVAVGGFLYPALIRQGYPKDFSLGLVTSAGAIGLLFFPSPLVMIYGFVAGVDVNYAYLATFPPAMALMIALSVYASRVAIKHKVPRSKFVPGEVAGALWDVKWELAAPLLVAAGLGSGLMELDESAAAAALYMLIVEVYVYKDLTWRAVLTVAKDALSLSGALILILAMATAMTNYIIQEQIPLKILDFFLENGMTEAWQFIVVLNIFLFIMGMLMDAFSIILVALPLLLPLASTFGIHPFHMAVMFLLNMELAYITPPVGLNLFISSFRFNKPVTTVYRVVLPFVALLYVGLILLIVFPRISSFTVEDKVAAKRAEAAAAGVSPREAWILECVQMDKNNPRPCTPEDKATYGEDGTKLPGQPGGEATPGVEAPVQLTKEEAQKQKADNEDLFAEMMGESGSTSTGSGADAGTDAGAETGATTGSGADGSTSSGGDGSTSSGSP
jgi:tripartite ATP-independent transporter DctM subunit